MNEEITNKGKMANDGSDTFFQLYAVSLKKLGEFFSHTYSLTCLNKDTSFLLKVINI